MGSETRPWSGILTTAFLRRTQRLSGGNPEADVFDIAVDVAPVLL
jgi:hypothetical protein